MALMSLFTGKEWRCRHRDGLWTQQGKERVGQTGKVAVTDTHDRVWKRQRGELLRNTGGSACSVTTRRVGGERAEAREGGHTNIRRIMADSIVVQQKPTQHRKATILQLKKLV